MENRALLAFALSLAILIGYQVLFAPVPPTPPELGHNVESLGTPSAPSAVAQTPGGTPPPPTLPGSPTPVVRPALPAARLDGTEIARASDSPENTFEVSTDRFDLKLTTSGGRIRSFKLHDYNEDITPQSPRLDMVRSNSLLPFGVVWVDAAGNTVDDREVVYEISGSEGAVGETELREIVLRGRGAGGEPLEKRISIENGTYVLHVSASVGERRHSALGMTWTRSFDVDGGGYYVVEGPAAYVDGDLEAISSNSIEQPEVFSGSISWGGYADHYFLAAYFPEEPAALRFSATAGAGLGLATLWNDNAGESVSYSLYVGPKSIHGLGEIGHDLGGAIDLGFFELLARPLYEILAWINGIVGNYGIAIILLTILIRLVLHPVSKKQMESMKAMQRIQPEVKKLQEKFADDREKMNKEMMELYRRHKVNPLGGCLPMLLQFPFFLGLYNVLMQAIELRHAPFLGWITDLSQPDRLGNLPIPFVEPAGIPVMTLLMGASMLLQQRMTPQTGDPQQQKIMMLMPVMFTVMFVNFASGLVLYWLMNNILSIGQQYMTNRSPS